MCPRKIKLTRERKINMRFAQNMKNAILFAMTIMMNLLPPVRAASERPNVVIILADDQGYGDLSLTGNPVLKTPNMDKLAREGVQLRNFHTDSYCTPTRSALMTGRYAHRVGGWGTVNGRNMLRDDEVTMADVFHHNGYVTGQFGKWHLGTSYPYRPIDRGFDEWLGKGDGGVGCATDYWGNDRVNDHYIHNGAWEKETRPGYECDVFFDAAMQFIRNNKSRPFFTYLAPYNPHSPCSIPDVQWLNPFRGRNVPGDFFATITCLDENLGRIRKFLQDEGLAGNTLLIYLSDNGSAEGSQVFNAGMRGKKGSPYDGGHREPCFLYWPAGGLGKPKIVDRLVAHLDLLPTFVDVCGLQLPKTVTFDGMSLKPLLMNPNADWPDRTIVLGTPHQQPGAKATPPVYGKNCSVMTQRWRLVEDKELYDMTVDPGQNKNCSASNPQVVANLRAAYKKYWQDVSQHDEGWHGRPIIGSPQQTVTDLCAEDWLTTKGVCPWNQGSVAQGKSDFGCWPVRFASGGTYRVEVSRWPRELNAPMAGVPNNKKIVDAWLDDKPVVGTLYRSAPKSLPVAMVRLRMGDRVQEAKVSADESVKSFEAEIVAGPSEIEATLLDQAGQPLCSACYVSVQKER